MNIKNQTTAVIAGIFCMYAMSINFAYGSTIGVAAPSGDATSSASANAPGASGMNPTSGTNPNGIQNANPGSTLGNTTTPADVHHSPSQTNINNSSTNGL